MWTHVPFVSTNDRYYYLYLSYDHCSSTSVIGGTHADCCLLDLDHHPIFRGAFSFTTPYQSSFDHFLQLLHSSMIFFMFFLLLGHCFGDFLILHLV